MQILIVKTSSLGDIIHAFPTLSFLRKKFPTATIDWVVEGPFAELVKSHPDVSNVLCIESKLWRKGKSLDKLWSFWRQLRSKRYDLVVDLQGNIKSGLITSQVRSSAKIGFSWKAAREPINTFFTHYRYTPPVLKNISEDNLFIVQSYLDDFTPVEMQPFHLTISSSQQDFLNQLLSQLPSGLKILVCPGSRWPNKKVTMDALAELLKKINAHQKCTFLFLWGNSEEKEEVTKLGSLFPNNSMILDKMPLSTLQNLMGKLDLVIAMDSLPLHLAATSGVKTFSIFGASLASKYKPMGKNHLAVQGDCPYGRTFDKRCPILRTCQTGLCIKGLTGEVLFKNVCDALEKKSL